MRTTSSRTAAAIALGALLLAAFPLASARGEQAARAVPAGEGERLSYAPLSVGDHERLLVIAPHPDDETIGAGGLIQRVLERGGSVRVVLMTAGDAYIEAVTRETHKPKPRSADYVAFGERRIRESRAAMRELDRGRIRLQLLGFPDGGLDTLLRAHWRAGFPERSATTGATDPPYDGEAVEPDVPYDGADLRRELAAVVRDARPTLIALPDPHDTHPDHHAAGVFGLLAVGDWLVGQARASLQGPMAERLPRIFGYLVHWPNWPPGAEQMLGPSEARRPLLLPADLPAHGRPRVALELDGHERERKAAAMARYATQQAVMPEMLAAFVRGTEPFIQLGPAEVHEAPQEVGPEAAPRGSPAAASGGSRE